jgi:transcription termination factor Rho
MKAGIVSTEGTEPTNTGRTSGGEPLSDWEIELAEHEGTPIPDTARRPQQRSGAQQRSGGSRDGGPRDGGSRDGGPRDRDGGDSNRNRNRRRRRGGGTGRGIRDEGPQGSDRYEIDDEVASTEPLSTEPVDVSGYLDLRDEGYGFLRVRGYLPSRDDSYVSVRLTRQYGLRKGDYVTGVSKPAGRGEKNPALLEVRTVNGAPADKAKGRPRVEDLTPLFPDSKLVLESAGDPANMTARIIDLIAPIGKGQRGMIVSPPKAGKTTVMKTIASAIEKNHPEVNLIVLLIDERPEEVTDMRRTVKGEVIASTFDRPSEEHTIVAEMTIEKAKRLVEIGKDVVIILDGITRLSRAYNLAAPATGRIMSGGIDAGALYPPKKFFGAARNVEEGGSLTILATALVETNSRMDDAIFEEFKGTGNMELRLDRKVAERRIYPAIDVDASSTRHEELLFDRKQLQMVWKLRRVLSGLAADGNAAPGLELLMDRLRTFKNNDEFLAEIAKQPGA